MTFTLYGPDPSVYDTSNRKPHVIIIGAGLSGLTLAALLHRADIPFDIFEKSPEARNVGSAIFLGPNVGPLFTQLGIMEEYIAKSKYCNAIRIFNENREQDFFMDSSLNDKMGGFEGRILPRKVLYEIILSRVPEERIHRAKRMSWMTQGENGVHVKFTDGSEFEGDILVGADGAYSAVRKCLFERLKKDNQLPASDAVEPPFSCVCVAGYSGPLDPEKFPFLKENWNVFAVKDDKMCWNATLYLDAESSKFHNNFRTTDWGEGGAESMCNDVRDFPIPGGDGTLTLGDVIDKTPKDQMTKVMLEEKVFDTWYHCRTVLIGDACHKLHPAGAQGANMAIQDAVALANWINVIATPQVKDVEKAFQAYREERHAAAQVAATLSKSMCRFYGKVRATAMSLSLITRFIAKNMSTWMWEKVMVAMVRNRPQASFLPFVQDHGTVKAAELNSYRETLKIIKAREAERAAAAEVAAGVEVSVTIV
ncbi:hypothetical protein BG015_011020 [Linnemannia schmuckeri]|uniref:FAD-binding domain-containing protein n=1 Tax=Linnemannia schmuckeri TaxID=64567 RepID=A0A9P5RW04_9FUNG|nr:hypothetical protein BG015_011020 [Linnemannia schmuckeri]